MKKIIKVSERPIDCRHTGSMSWKTYSSLLSEARKIARKEGKQIITKDGIEDYSKKMKIIVDKK
jgi:hypothetical protein